jgi:hypothetical protein
MLLPKRASAFWEGHKKSSMVFQKICWEEPKKQKTRSCRAQELSRSCAQWRGWEWRQCIETGSTGANEDRSHRTKGRQNARPSLVLVFMVTRRWTQGWRSFDASRGGGCGKKLSSRRTRPFKKDSGSELRRGRREAGVPFASRPERKTRNHRKRGANRDHCGLTAKLDKESAGGIIGTRHEIAQSRVGNPHSRRPSSQ